MRHAPRLVTIARMSESILLTFSDQLADAVATIAPAVVQVHGRRRPASGVIYSRGVVLTTTRALGREDGLQVRSDDGRTFDAELAGWDPATSLALLRASGLETNPPAVAEKPPRVGHLGLAVARSWSNSITASAGNIAVIGGPLPTGRGRAIDQVIRTTAPMHDGFAGGAFIDGTGHLIGIATATAIRGLEVIIPAEIAWKTAETLLQHGRMRRGYLGVAGQAVRLSDRQREAHGREQALVVVSVSSGSPADSAGILVGDLLMDFDGHPVESPEDLLDLLTDKRIGSQVTLRVLRGGAVQDLTVTVGERADH